MNLKKSEDEKSIILNEQLKKSLVIKQPLKYEAAIPDDFSKITCFSENCKKIPIYTIGSLLPSVWFDPSEKLRLIPVIFASCIEHRFDLIKNLPEKIVSIIIRDLSRDSYRVIADMLKEALDKKEEELILYVRT